MASVIIPAHNEEDVIGATLASVFGAQLSPPLEVIVVCNGCTDDTAAVARLSGDDVKVVETPVASKTDALNLGDSVATSFPRVYLDADVVVTPGALEQVLVSLAAGQALAAEPVASFDTSGASLLVREYYTTLVGLHGRSAGDVGCGMYAMSREGRSRFDTFPNVIADDAYARAHFSTTELIQVRGSTTIVRAPARLSDLVAIKTRSRLGVMQLRLEWPDLWEAKSAATPSLRAKAGAMPMRSWLGIPIFVYVQIASRVRARKLLESIQDYQWHKDDSSRSSSS